MRCCKLALFSLLAVCVSAFFMSNLSGVYGRYHTRIGFLVIFPGMALAFRWAGDLIERFGLLRKTAPDPARTQFQSCTRYLNPFNSKCAKCE